MKIAIDCRYYGMSGIGRVLEGILDNLDYETHTYYLIGQSKKLENYKKANLIENQSNPFSLNGLIDFPKEINKICDAIIIPNFIIPFGIKINVFCIVHDLIFLDLKISTKNFFDYLVKNILLKKCFKKSTSIFCDSRFTMNRAHYYFKKNAKKCVLNYPGISKNVIEYYNKNKEKEIIKENKIIFIGNVKPHKGIQNLLEAFKKCSNNNLVLKIIGQKDSFLNGIDISYDKYDNVIFTGKISDEELFNEISTAKFLVQPSKYEGFGLPPLEALYLGTRPIVSTIDVFHEVYDNLPVIYFKDNNDLSEKINNSDPLFEKCNNYIFKKYNYANYVDRMVKLIYEKLNQK